MLRKVSICLALIALILCLWLWFEHNAFDMQMKIRLTAFSIGNGPSTYGFLADTYFFVACLLLTFVIGKLIRPKIMSFTVATSSLCLIIFQFWEIKKWYSFIINTFPYYNNDPDFELLRNSVLFVCVCFSVALILFIIQLITMFSSQENQRDERSLFKYCF
jgi:hypothetical protein